MRTITLLTSLVSLAACATAPALEPPVVTRTGREVPNEAVSVEQLRLTVSDVATGLDTVWDMTWGPDGWIWFTERGGSVSRVDPRTGTLVHIADVPSYERGESGLMGIALDPDFGRNPEVYLMQSYSAGSRIANRLLRFTYRNGTLEDRRVLLDGIQGNTYHDGSRIVFGPDGYLYITTGDAGQPDLAQDISSLNGKVLRVTRDGAPAPGNPFGNEVFSYGHRNPQGIVFQPGTGRLFITEHGPRDNDEVSIVTTGGNFGWPAVHGFCDDDTAGETAFCTTHDVVAPIAAWTPTIAPSGATFYSGGTIRGWDGAFLFTTLKGSALVVLELAPDGSVVTQKVVAERRFGRLRDVLVGSDGAIYLATSNLDGRGTPQAGDDRIVRLGR